jgi:uncharacterized protein (DUF58 family)
MSWRSARGERIEPRASGSSFDGLRTNGTPLEFLATVRDLELVARIIVEGLVSGLHRSPFHGYSAEFNQYRHYQPGDDLKYVDWKLVARTDRVYTKQFRETTNMAAALVVDASASMAFPETLSKMRYATVTAAALAYVTVRQGDAAGLVTAGDRGDVFLPARTGRPHLARILAALSRLKPRGTWRPAAAIRVAAERLKRRGMLIVLSDFYDDEDGTFAELRRASHIGHDIVVIHILSREELDFPYDRDLELTDLESGQRVAVNTEAARRDYKAAVAEFVERCRQRAGAEGFQYGLVTTDTPPDRALRNILLARA